MCLPGSNGTSEDDVFLNYCGANKCHEPQGVNDDSHSVSRDVHKCRLRFIYASCVSCCGLESWPTLKINSSKRNQQATAQSQGNRTTLVRNVKVTKLTTDHRLTAWLITDLLHLRHRSLLFNVLTVCHTCQHGIHYFTEHANREKTKLGTTTTTTTFITIYDNLSAISSLTLTVSMVTRCCPQVLPHRKGGWSMWWLITMYKNQLLQL